MGGRVKELTTFALPVHVFDGRRNGMVYAVVVQDTVVVVIVVLYVRGGKVGGSDLGHLAGHVGTVVVAAIVVP